MDGESGVAPHTLRQQSPQAVWIIRQVPREILLHDFVGDTINRRGDRS